MEPLPEENDPVGINLDDGSWSRASASRRSCMSRSLTGSVCEKKLAEYNGALLLDVMKPPRPSETPLIESLEAAPMPLTFYMAPALKARDEEPVEFLRSERRLFAPPLELGDVGELDVWARSRDMRRAAFVRTRRLKGSGAALRDLEIISCSVSRSVDLFNSYASLALPGLRQGIKRSGV